MLHVPGPYLQREFGWSVSLVGLCFGVCAILYAVASPLAGCAKAATISLSQNAQDSDLPERRSVCRVMALLVSCSVSSQACSGHRRSDFTHGAAANCAPCVRNIPERQDGHAQGHSG